MISKVRQTIMTVIQPSMSAGLGNRNRLFPQLRAFCNITLLLVFVAAGIGPVGTVFGQSPGLISTYDTGLGSNGAEIISVRDSWGLLTNAGDGSIDILNLADPSNIQLVRRVKTPELVGLTSVAIHPYQDYFIAVAGSAKAQATPQVGTASFFRLSDGVLLKTVSVGIQPDAVVIAPNGLYALVANEAEGFAVGDNGGNGSLTLLDLLFFYPDHSHYVHVRQVTLPSLTDRAGFSVGRTDDLARLPIDQSPGTLEPEFITFSADSQYAFVTLQENNGVIRLNLWYYTWSFFGLGQTTHEVDITNDGLFNPNTIGTFFREPDGIDVAYADSQLFFVTADEGDTRDSAGNTGPRGGRTVSIFTASGGRLVADTGGQIDALAAARGIYPDARSTRGGAEPEGIDAIRVHGRTIVAVGLERANAVAFMDMTTPTAPVVYDLVPVGAAPEGVKLIYRNYKLYAITANEGAGTLSVVLVPGLDANAAGSEALAEESGAEVLLETMTDFVTDDLTAEVTQTTDGYTLYLPLINE